MTAEEYGQQVDARAERMLEEMAGRANSLWSAHALMARGKKEQVEQLIYDRFGKPNLGPFGRVASGTFEIQAAMLLVCCWGDGLAAEAVERVRQVMTRGMLDRGNTENHWLMHYAANLLAAERWGDADVWWNGLPPQAMHQEAKRWILGMIARTALNGHHEYDSPQYHLCHVLAMISLADHARDEQVQSQAEKVLTLLVADMALEYFKGSWAGGHSREGYRDNTRSRPGSISGLEFFYFGGEEFDPGVHLHDMVGPALTARYRPPALLAAMAWDRDSAHVVRKTKAPRTIFRHVDGESRAVRKYTYMSKSFALGSTQVGLPGEPAGPIDLISWDLTWEGADQQAKITCNHPYRDAGRFSAFLSELPQTIGRGVPTDKPYLQFADRLFGASPYERVMQHEGTVVALYRIPPTDENRYLNLFLPKSIDWTERNGWILGDSGDFHVALYPIGSYRWVFIREENLIDGWLLRIEGEEVGLVLEVVEAEDFEDFGKYVGERAGARPDLNDWPRAGRVSVATWKGERLEIVYDGEHKVNGEVIDYEAYPLYGAPGVEAELGIGKVVFRKGGERVELDFGVDPDGEMLPMRVIG
jgi:hypothetical protein